MYLLRGFISYLAVALHDQKHLVLDYKFRQFPLVSAISDLLFLFCYILRFEFLMLSNEISFYSHIIPEIAFYICSTAQLWFRQGCFVSLNINFPMLSSKFLCCVYPEYTIQLWVFYYFWRPCNESICPFVDCHITANNCNNPGFKSLKYGNLYLPCTRSTAVKAKSLWKVQILQRNAC